MLGQHLQVENVQLPVRDNRKPGKLGRGHLAFALVGMMLVGIALGVTLAHDSHREHHDVKIPIDPLIPAIVASDSLYPAFALKLVALVNEFPVPDEIEAVDLTPKIGSHALAFIRGPTHALRQGFPAVGGGNSQPATRPTAGKPCPPGSQRGTALGINRGPAKEDDCAIKNAGLVPSKTPVMFGGGMKYKKDYSNKIAIGHVIPAVVTVCALYPSFAPKLIALLNQYPATV